MAKATKDLLIALNVVTTGVDSLQRVVRAIEDMAQTPRDSTTTMAFRGEGIDNIRRDLEGASKEYRKLAEEHERLQRSLREGSAGTTSPRLKELQAYEDAIRRVAGEEGRLPAEGDRGQQASQLRKLREEYQGVGEALTSAATPGAQLDAILQKINQERALLKGEIFSSKEGPRIEQLRLRLHSLSQQMAEVAARRDRLQAQVPIELPRDPQRMRSPIDVDKWREWIHTGGGPAAREMAGLLPTEKIQNLKNQLRELADARAKLREEALHTARVLKETGQQDLFAPLQRRLPGAEATKRVPDPIEYRQEDLFEGMDLDASNQKLNQMSDALNTVKASAETMGPQVTKEMNDVAKATDEAGKKTNQMSSAFDALGKLVKKRGGIIGEFIYSIGRLSFYAAASGLIYGVVRALRFAISEGVRYQQVMADIQGILPSRSEVGRDVVSDIVIESSQKFAFSLTETAEAAKLFAQTGRDAIQIGKDLAAAFQAVRGAGLELNQAADLIVAIENITDGGVAPVEMLDRIARIEAVRAVTAQDLAVAFQRLGPLVTQLRGDTAGLVDEFDYAMASVTAIVERTRVTGNQAATSLRFILSRLGRPEIVASLQSLTGVRLAREGGRELRPFQEILEEVSSVYQTLMETGDTGRAFQILSVLGGARQLQATSTLLANYHDVQETARASAMGFLDIQERTDISMRTVSTAVEDLSISFGNLGREIVEVTSGPVSFLIRGLAGAVDGITSLSEAARRDSRRTQATMEQYARSADPAARTQPGRTPSWEDPRFRFRPIDVSDIDPEDYTKLKDLASFASQAGMSVSELAEHLEKFSADAYDNLLDRYGMESIEEFSAALRENIGSGDDFRGLRDEIGMELVRSLAESSEEFQNYVSIIDTTNDVTEAATTRTLALSRAYTVLGNSVFASLAASSLNAQRATLLAGEVGNEFSLRIDRQIENLREGSSGFDRMVQAVRIGFPTVRSTIRAIATMDPLSSLDPSLIPQATVREIDRTVQSKIIQPLRDGFGEIGDVFFGAAGAADAYAASLDRVARSAKAGEDIQTTALRALDDYTTTFLSLTDNETQAVDALTNRLLRLVDASEHLGDGMDIGSLLVGAQFESFLNRIMNTALSNIERIYGATIARDLSAALEEDMQSFAAQAADFLRNQTTGFVQVKQRLFEVVSGFTQATTAAQRMDEAFRNIGIGFDLQESQFQAARTHLESLIKLPVDLTSEAAAALNQSVNFADKLFEQFGDLGTPDDLREAIRRTGVGDEEGMGALAQRSRTTMETLHRRYEGIASQIAQIDTQTLQDLFGPSKEGQDLKEMFEIIARTKDLSPDEALANYSSLIVFATRYLDLLRQERLERELGNLALEQELSRVQALARIQERGEDARSDLRLRTEEARHTVLEGIVRARGNEDRMLQQQLSNARAITALEISEEERRAQIRLRNLAEEGRVQEAVLRNTFDQNHDLNELTLAMEKLTNEQHLKEQEITEELKQRREQLAADLGLREQEMLGQRFVDAYSAMSEQVRANVEAATSGMVEVLTSYEALTSRGALRTVLAPIGETYISRIGENMIRSLFDASSDSFLGNLAAAYGSGPESQMRDSIIRAMELAGTDFTSKLRQVNEEFLSRYAIIMGTEVPAGEGTGGTITPSPGRSGAEIVSQAATLAAGMTTAAIADARGGSAPNAQIGAGVGTAVASAIFQGSLVAGPIGALVGGLVGGLFGSSKEDEQEERQIQALNKIEYNTDRSANVLELQRQFMDVARGAVNVPTAFNLPGYAPTGGGAQVQQTNQIVVEVSVYNPASGDDVIQSITTSLGPRLTEEIRNIGL